MAQQAYVVGRITVKDAALWAEYRSKVPDTLSPWGAELLFRGEAVATLGGYEEHSDIVTIGFPSVEAARGWFASPAYQALVALRQRAADVVLVVYASP
ncbi:coronamic acid biosynthesis protein CmaL [Comamonas faecalis]|uniref:Coronamic acid biosynthesis protein CmaL n=1 Tax=Comamonas faecalis TaxID=1387849 RepID=A0ABP7RI04_9BURK